MDSTLKDCMQASPDNLLYLLRLNADAEVSITDQEQKQLMSSLCECFIHELFKMLGPINQVNKVKPD